MFEQAINREGNADERKIKQNVSAHQDGMVDRRANEHSNCIDTISGIWIAVLEYQHKLMNGQPQGWLRLAINQQRRERR